MAIRRTQRKLIQIQSQWISFSEFVIIFLFALFQWGENNENCQSSRSKLETSEIYLLWPPFL